MSEGMKNRFSTQFQQVASGSQELVEHYPFSAAATAFGVGVGIGVALAILMTEPPRRVPQDYAHRVAQQVLGALSNVLPEAIASRLS